MGIVLKIIVSSVLVLLIAYKIHKSTEVIKAPKLENTWWGRGSPDKEDTSIKPFKIQISDAILKDLQNRLQSARPLTPPLENSHQHYGMNTQLLSKIVDFWRTKYNWRDREQFLNQFPQYTVSVQGLRIHYIHAKPENPGNRKVLPILLVHGWPGSVREFYELIPLLTNPPKESEFVFEVIAPSLPGYGFSEGAVRPGLGVIPVAVLFKNFMERIGFKQYYVQGGDWGAIITQHLSVMFPEKVLGSHSNMCTASPFSINFKVLLGSLYPSLLVDKEFEHKIYPLSNFYSNLLLETGYSHIQATKPDTVGVGLNDSPVGLAAYLLEKFITWTNPEWKNLDDGGLTKKFTYTNLLDNVMIYWVTGSITTSMRLYAETISKAHLAIDIDRVPVTVPAACARFMHELGYPTTSALKEKYHNLVQLTDFKDGGHFPAFEVPQVLAEDIFSAIKKMQLPKTNK